MTSVSTYNPGSSQSEGIAGTGLSPASTLVLGAVAGVALGYLYFTDHGRDLRERFEPMIETWVRELNRLRESADRARAIYTEGRAS